MSGESKVKLKSGDGKMFEVDEAVAYESVTIRNVMEDTESLIIPLPDVPANLLAKVLEYCQYHVEVRKRSEKEEAIPDDIVKRWDAEFISMPYPNLAELLGAANYLYIKNLLELGSQAVADMMMKGKTAAQIREAFGIVNDLTPEEEEGITKQNQWVFG